MSYADALGAVSTGMRCQSTSTINKRIASSSQPTLDCRPKRLASIWKPLSGRRFDGFSLRSYEARRGREAVKLQITAAADGESPPVVTKDRSALLSDLKAALDQVSEYKYVGNAGRREMSDDPAILSIVYFKCGGS